MRLPILQADAVPFRASQAVRDYQANKKGALPLSGSAPPAPPTCSPACKWGNCVKVGKSLSSPEHSRVVLWRQAHGHCTELNVLCFALSQAPGCGGKHTHPPPHATQRQGKCVCYAGYAGPACSNATSRANECNGIAGINLEGPADYAHSWNFVDAMKMGRRWISQVRGRLAERRGVRCPMRGL